MDADKTIKQQCQRILSPVRVKNPKKTKSQTPRKRRIFTSEENEALNYLLNTGINPKPEHSIPSASAGSEMDIPRVEKELRTSLQLAGLPAPDPDSFLHIPEEPLPSTSGNNDPVQSQSTKEPVLKMRCLSKKDIDAATRNLKKGSNTKKKEEET